jgi:hypothetical protein
VNELTPHQKDAIGRATHLRREVSSFQDTWPRLNSAELLPPITWSELERGVDPKEFTVYSVPKRLASLRRDPWGGYAALRQSIGAAALRKLGVSAG